MFCEVSISVLIIKPPQVAVCFWPLVQTVNFAYVPERNRVVVVSMASFMWTVFLSYMHHIDQDSLPTFLQRKKITAAEVQTIDR